MALDLAELGLTKEELQERVVEKICERMLSEHAYHPEDGEYKENSKFSTEIQKLVKERLNKSINDLAEQHILPNVSRYVENLTLQETNRWGEKSGKTMTFIEYLVARAESYLREDVNFEGKSKEENSGYSWSKSQTRIVWLVNKHLQYSIESAMKEAVRTINDAVTEGLEKTVKVKLEEIAKSLKVNLKMS
jgi:hypothetical protein